MTIHDEGINLNILIIEDNPGDYQLILNNLEEKFAALTVSHAQNAREAEAFLLDDSNYYNAILLDLNLPDKGGKELIEFVVNLSGNTPVIILSGYSDIRFSIQSLSMGIVDFLNKDEISPALLQKSILYSIERKHSSMKLQESEKHYRKLFQLSPEPMFLIENKTHKILDANRAAIQHYGYSRKELLAMTADYLYQNDDFKKYEKTLAASLNSPKTYHGNYNHVLKNGKTITVEIHSSLISQNGSDTRAILARDITAHKKSQDELLKTKKLLEQSSQVSRVGGYEVNLENGRCDWSAVTKAIHEVPEHFEPDLKAALRFYKEGESREKITEIMSRVVDSGEHFDEELQIVTARGNERWIRVIGKTECKNGRCIRLIGTIQDIHEKKIAEKKLQESYANYQSLINNIRETIYRATADNHFKILFISSHIEDLTGYPADEFIDNKKRPLSHIIHPEDKKSILKKIHHCIKTGQSWEIEYRIIHKNGDVRWVYEKGYVVNDSSGRPDYVDGFLLDITDRKKVEDQLRINEEAFRESFENAAIGMVLISHQGDILKVNKSFCEIIGYNQHELIGLHFTDITHPGKHSSNRRYFYNLISGKIDYFHLERRYFHKKGAILWVKLSVSMIKDQNGEPLYFVVQVTDITSAKKAKFELEKLNDQLEEKIEVRTRQLKIANQELESFSYSVSHDLRAPLRAIDGFSKAVFEEYVEVLDETGKNYLSRVRKASQKLSMLIDSFLNLAKVTSTPMDFKPVNISKISHNVIELLGYSDSKRACDIYIQPNMQAHADPELIKIAIQNLLENAWKYSSKELFTRIEFGCKKIDGKKTYYIKDNGVGFNMDYYDKLFKPFQRLHHASEFQGTGIGLATVKRIIDRHNGDFWATSVVGHGATFFFTLSPLSSVSSATDRRFMLN